MVRYRKPLYIQLSSIHNALFKLGKRIEERCDMTRRAEYNTAFYPTVDYYCGGMCAVILPFQRQALASPALRRTPSFWMQLAGPFIRGGQSFIRGIKRPATALEEEMILPGVFRLLADVIKAIKDSVERFSKPGPWMFDLKKGHTASALFGESVLLARSILESTDDIVLMIDDITSIVRFFKEPAATPGGILTAAARGVPAAPAGSGGSPGSQPGTFDMITRGIMGLTIVIPVFTRMLYPLFKAFQLRFYQIFLSTLQKIEREVFEYRRMVIDFFYNDLREYAKLAYEFTIAAQFVILPLIDEALKFFSLYIPQFMESIQLFLEMISVFLQKKIDLINFFISMWQAVMNIQIAPGVTIGQMIDVLFRLGVDAARNMLTLGSALLEAQLRNASLIRKISQGVAPIILGHDDPVSKTLDNWADRIAAFREVADRVLRFPIVPLEETGLRPVYKKISSSSTGWDALQITRILDTLGGQARNSILNFMAGGVSAFTELGQTFREQAEGAAGITSTERFRGMVIESERRANAMFGKQIAHLKKQIGMGRDPLAKAFEIIMARSGFSIITALLPAYIEYMIDYWSRADAKKKYPTSPHILDRRAGGGRIHVGELEISMLNRPLTEENAEAVAVEFKKSIIDLYLSRSTNGKQAG